jgi:hypothetical protein
MPATYDPLATTTLNSAASSVTFSSISGSYTDLILIVSAKSSITSGFPALRVTINSDTGSNYSLTQMTGDGSTVNSSLLANTGYAFIGNIPNTNSSDWGSVIAQFMNYSNTTTNKTILSRINNAENSTVARVTLWRNTAAISTIFLTEGNGVNFIAGSTFTLYGIKAA